MTPKTHQLFINNLQMTVYEWGEPIDSHPSLIFFHATGFHGRCWDAVIRELDGYHCYTVDAPGHGSSQQPELSRTWQQYGADATEIVRRLGLTDAVGIGHSMGGNMVVRAAAALPDAFAALLLIDPVIFPREQYAGTDYTIDGHFVLNRRRKWASVDEMVESYHGRGPFENWQDDVLRDYCTYGSVPTDNGIALACPPELEAHIYQSGRLATNIDVYDAVAAVQVPVHVIRCSEAVAQTAKDLAASPTAPNLAAQFANGTDCHYPAHSHFMPMEAPATIGDHILMV